MEEFKKLLGNRIKYIRRGKKISQEKLAELLDISPTSISNLETGKCAISMKTLYKLAKIFNVEFYELFLFETPDPKEKLLKQLQQNIDSKEIKDNIENIMLLCKILEKIKSH